MPLHAVCSAPCQVDSEKNKNIISGIPPCCAAGWNFSRGCAMKFHRRHAFEYLPVTLVVVKIEITLNCRKLLKVKAVFLRKRAYSFKGFFFIYTVSYKRAAVDEKHIFLYARVAHSEKKCLRRFFCKPFAGSSCGIPGRLNLF